MCDARGTVADTIAVRDGSVLAVGSAEAVRAGACRGQRGRRRPRRARRHIRADRHLMHFGAIAEPLVDLTDATSHQDIAGQIADRVAATPPGDWIMATPVGEPHYFIRRSYRDLPERELPGREVLDRAAPASPVFIQAWAPVVPNVCALNSLALRRLGISGATPDRVDDVRVEKDAAGEPTGVLRGSVTNYYCDSPFMNRLLKQVPVWHRDAIAPGAMRAMRAADAMGVTAVYEAHLMTFSLIEIYRLLRRQDRLTVRVLCCPEAEPTGVPWTDPFQLPTLGERLDRARDITDRSDDMFRVDGVTVSPYGPCWPGFTLMREPYLDPYGMPTTGKTMVSAEEVGQAIGFRREHGVRLNVVTSGLAEADSHLAQLEALGPVPAGWLLQYLYFAEPELVRRFAALGFDLTTTMSFSWGKGTQERVRAHRPRRRTPLRGRTGGPPRPQEYPGARRSRCGAARPPAGYHDHARQPDGARRPSD